MLGMHYPSVPNSRAKNKKFVGLWLDEKYLQKVRKASKKLSISLSGYIVRLLTSRKRVESARILGRKKDV